MCVHSKGKRMNLFYGQWYFLFSSLLSHLILWISCFIINGIAEVSEMHVSWFPCYFVISFTKEQTSLNKFLFTSLFLASHYCLPHQSNLGACAWSCGFCWNWKPDILRALSSQGPRRLQASQGLLSWVPLRGMLRLSLASFLCHWIGGSAVVWFLLIVVLLFSLRENSERAKRKEEGG
jgi:hypothetical protein